MPPRMWKKDPPMGSQSTSLRPLSHPRLIGGYRFPETYQRTPLPPDRKPKTKMKGESTEEREMGLGD